MGSKAKITKYIVPIIQRKIDESGARYYVEPFAGGCNVIDKIKHMDKEDNAPYIIWQKEGLLTVTTAAGGIKTDYKTILAHLHNIIDEYDIDLTAIGYDPHNASAFLLDLEDFGCDLVEIKQSARSLNDATIDFQL